MSILLADGVLSTGSTVNVLTIYVISGSSGDGFLVSVCCLTLCLAVTSCCVLSVPQFRL